MPHWFKLVKFGWRRYVGGGATLLACTAGGRLHGWRGWRCEAPVGATDCPQVSPHAPCYGTTVPVEQYGLLPGSGWIPAYSRFTCAARTAATRALILSLTDEGRLGVVTQGPCSRKLQCQLAADTRMRALERESGFCTTLKQLRQPGARPRYHCHGQGEAVQYFP